MPGKKRALKKPGRELLPAAVPTYTLEIMGREFPVRDMASASNAVEIIRDRNGYGVSEMGGEFPIRENGVVIGFVSYNGRVWKGQPGDDQAELVYSP